MKKCAEEAEILFRKKKKQKDEYVKIDSVSETSYVLTPKSDIAEKSANNLSRGIGIKAMMGLIKKSANSSRDSKLKSASHIPKCPTCGSESIEKISVGTKIFFLGPFASLYKTFKCSSCGYKW